MEPPETAIYAGLSAGAKERTFVVGSGELAFRQEDLGAVARLAAQRELLILGGEAWMVNENGSRIGIIPGPDGSSRALHWDFSEDERGNEESWSGYCQRSARLMLAAVKDLSTVDIDWSKANGYRLMWHITFTVKDEHSRGSRLP